jgi:hypothetical protein
MAQEGAHYGARRGPQWRKKRATDGVRRGPLWQLQRRERGTAREARQRRNLRGSAHRERCTRRGYRCRTGGGGVLLPLQEVSQPQCVQLRKASEAREVRQSEAAVERDRVQRGARGQGVHVAQGVAAGQREHLQAAAP